MTAQTPAQRAAKKRQRKRAKNLRPVEVWIPDDGKAIHIVKELEDRLVRANTA